MKKLTIFALLAALCSILLIVSCQDPFSMYEYDGEKPATGEGFLVLNLNGISVGRTILPPTVLTSEIAVYELVFTATGRDTVSVDRYNYDLSNNISLFATTWNLTVTAYKDSGKTIPVACANLSGIEITSGGSTSRSLDLTPIVESGTTGKFKWNINYPSQVISASVTITPLDETTGSPEQTLYFIGGNADNTVDKNNASSPLELNTGYYRVVFRLSNGVHTAGREEYMHIYQNLESSFDYSFTDGHFTIYIVSNGNDSGVGSLRYAIQNAVENSTITIAESVGTINLISNIQINKNLTINGNGVTITNSGSSYVFYIEDKEIKINRIWFKDIKNSSAINNYGTLTLESCIFSDNGNRGISYGAVRNWETATIKGCTFYGNSANYGGAILNYTESLTLTGNLFYGNTANYYPVVYNGWSGAIYSSYNVIDVPFGSGNNQCGWAEATGDKQISNLPVSPKTFKLLYGSEALNVIDSLPLGYPTEDFYGNPITNGAAAGAVQSIVSGSGWYLDVTLNNDDAGEVDVTGATPNEDGLIPGGSIDLTASINSGYGFSYWLVNGTVYNENPLNLNISDHTIVKAMFNRTVTVTSNADTNTEGTLRYALNNAQEGDIISIELTAPDNVIELTNNLPQITKSIKLEGNGATITRALSWTAVSWDTALFRIISADVTINRVWFKNGISNQYGGAIGLEGGTLTLNSCIFSGNQGNYGGAIGGSNFNLSVYGCTFFDNIAVYYSGAIYNGNPVFLGNLFYGNTSVNYPVMNTTGTRTSLGYNVVDKPFGTSSNQAGWTAATGDKQITNMPVSSTNFKLLSGSEAAGVIVTRPENYPTVDFYGNPIPATNAAAGAVQETVTGTGFYLDLSVNNSEFGTIIVSEQPDEDGLYEGTVSLEALPESDITFSHWLVDGIKEIDNPIDINLTDHTKVQAVFIRVVTVTSSSDETGSATTEGTLRYALTNAQDGDVIRFELTAPDNVIELTGSLPQITKSITIEGNGSTITRHLSWTTISNYSQLLYINSSSVVVNIYRLHLKDGRTNYYGSSILNIGNLTLESCIFNGNKSEDIQSNSSIYGGAIYNSGTMTVKGCTFYDNSATGSYGYGGAIYQTGSGASLFLTGNIFYGNKGYYNGNTGYYSVVYRSSGTVTSLGFNMVDVPLGTGSNQSGWTAHEKDIYITSIPISGKTFKLLSGSEAANVIDELPEDYPAVDFYGNPITDGAATGAVQVVTSGIGFYLDTTANDISKGNVTVSSSPDEDGLVSGSVTITVEVATGYEFDYWLVNDNNEGSENPLTFTIDAHTKVQAMYMRLIIVENSSDDEGSATTEGTLRYALTNANAQGVDIIRINLTAPDNVIKLTSALPQISRSITIEGNGATLTRASSWTDISDTSQLLYINYINYIGSTVADVNIKRLQFSNGRATSYGAAIRSNGNLTLESCIFNGNQTNGWGGAINFSRTLTIKGCTFYGNSANYGGAIYNDRGTLALTGNIFFNNTTPANQGPIVYRYASTDTSYGYNVVDVAFGTGNSLAGWTAATGDKYITSMPISGKTFKLLSGGDAVGVIDELPEGYPTVDFYGNAIPNTNAAAGAVQDTTSGIGYYLDVTVNDASRGSITVSPESNEDGLISGSVTITAEENTRNELAYWLVNGNKEGSENPLTFTISSHTRVQAVFARVVIVDNPSDAENSATTQGTLRYALTNAQDLDIIRFDRVTTIELTSALPQITRSVTIEGNGATITRASSWTTTSATSQLLYINSATAVVNISRLHFKNGRATDYGAAIRSNGTLTLESCIFSGNQTSTGSAYGGAIYNSGTMNIKGCTFYGNNSASTNNGYGGAVYTTGGLNLTGNLFYGNVSASSRGPVVYRYSGTVTSLGYNVVDVALGTGTTQAGWTAATGDKTVSSLSIIPQSFRLLTGSGAANVITTLPANYPTVDFYGNAITNGAAAGAVQAIADGYVVNLSVNNNSLGSASISQEPNDDGLYTGSITVTASAVGTNEFSHWLVNGVNEENANPFTITLDDHANIQAVFTGIIIVNSSSDETGSNTTPGTLRYALTNAQDLDIIRFSGVTTIELTSALPQITRSMTIEGNGATITRASSWTNSTQLLVINSTTAVVNISRIHFRDGITTNNHGAAVWSNGIITLESCIFSWNNASNASALGGAIFNGGTMNVRGCTFYGNSSAYRGGAIYNASGTLTLTGNLFFGNTAAASQGPIVYRADGTVTSNGHNIASETIGTGTAQSGWAAGTRDTTFATLGITGLPFNTSTFVPVSEVAGHILSAPANFPTADFNGNTRTWPGAPGAVK